MKIERCKGMRDLSPAEMTAFRHVEKICRGCFIKWGYQEVRTPTIEYLYLFTSAGTLTPGRLGKVYSFLDWDGWSGERVVLRPDGTIPVARLYTEKVHSGLARYFYASNNFIFEEGDKTRERWQCGAELIGVKSPAADAELVALSLEILNKLGLKNIELRLSHAGLIRALLTKLGLSAEEQHRTLDRIFDGNSEELSWVSREHPKAGDIIRSLLRFNGQSNSFLQSHKAGLVRNLPEISPALDDLFKTVKLLDQLGIQYKINIASGASFEYYTGLIFQIFVGEDWVCGGGRYDALIPSMGGGEVPASGFALYLDSLMDMVGTDDVASVAPEHIMVRALSDEALKESFKVAEGLRQAGYIAEFDMDGQSARWTLEVQNRAPLFALVDNKKSGKYPARTFRKILEMLEGEGAAKNSPA